MASLEETRYIANNVIPEQVNAVTENAGYFFGNLTILFWISVIAVLVVIITLLYRQNQKNSKNLQTSLDVVGRLSRSSNGTEIEKVFEDICSAAGGEHLAMYSRRQDMYGLVFEINLSGSNKHAVSMPLLINEKEAHSEDGKSGNFYITTFVGQNKFSVVRLYTRDKVIAHNSELYRQIQILCENGIKLYSLVSTELTTERQSRIAHITTKLSASFLSWQYDRERFFFFISNIIMKAIRAYEVLIHDEKNKKEYHYGKKGSQGVSKEFYIHHSGCRMTIVTAAALEPDQLNTIGGFVDSSYSLFVHEEDNLKHAEQFLQFLIHSNEAMELEFPYFNHHSDLVENIAVRLAHSLQLDASSIKNLEIAAKLHDIGMIADVSFSLGKQEKLSEGEMDTIRNHPLYGSIIVEPLNQIYPIGELIKCHHERYDGQGYPLGLFGNEIPLPAQILGFAEQFVGLISDRSYRPGKTFQQAVAEVKKMSGHAFDPVIVRAFEGEEGVILADLLRTMPTLKH